MRIGFISDLHIDMNKAYNIKHFIDAFHRLMDDEFIEAVVIGGDIANHYSLTITFVEKLKQQTNRPIMFIPGNHDYWQIKTNQKETHKIHELFQQHPQSLINSPWQLNARTGIVGHSAWYNHAFHGPQFNEEQLERGQYKLATWQDKKHLDWQESDKVMSKAFAKQVEHDIISSNFKEIILVTHMVTIKDFSVPMPNRAFDFFNAFIATDDFDAIYNKYPISTSIMGHVHFRHKKKLSGIDFIVNSLGYYKEWRQNDIYNEVKAAMYIMEV